MNMASANAARACSIRERAENPQGVRNVDLNVEGLTGRDRVLVTKSVSVHEFPQGVIGVRAYAPELGFKIVWGKLVVIH